VISIDPLDGSSNSDINGAVGTIFGIQRRKTTSGGDEGGHAASRVGAVAAGYVLYGLRRSCLHDGSGTNGFTLDTSIGSSSSRTRR